MATIAVRHGFPGARLYEARTRDDDWSGLADAAERRRRQNRLHQRAWRRRRVQQHPADEKVESASVAHSTEDGLATGATVQPSQPQPDLAINDYLQARSSVCRHLQLRPFSYWERLRAEREGTSTVESIILDACAVPDRLIPPMIPYLQNEDDEQPIFRFPLSPDHQLIVLIQFNVLRAVLTNLSILSLQDRMPLECRAAFNVACLPEAPSSIPPSLRPTSLQLTIPHDPWIDMIPFPAMRNNVLLSQEKTDQDALCEDALGGLYEGFDYIESRGIIIWGDPWSPSGWEVSEGFARNWRHLLVGCDELIEATQKYREARGEERLVIEI